MTLQLLMSCVGKNPHELVKTIHLGSDCILVNQKCPYGVEEFEENGFRVKALSMQEKGVGLSRTTALQRAEADLILFGDEDIVYEEGYAEMVEAEFAAHPEADMICFNVKVSEKRKTYWNEGFSRVRWFNCGRYPAYSFALRRDKLHGAGITYHLWFGGGAPYSCGEDSIFINDCLKKGLKVYASPVCIGEEIAREDDSSTWFTGYNEKFFYDRGVLYHYLYGNLAWVMQMRFLLKNKSVMCAAYPYAEAKKNMRRGRMDAKKGTPKRL